MTRTPYHDLYVATGITCFVLVMGHAASGRLNSYQQRNESCISIITSLAKEVMFLVALVSLSVCLFVCLSVDNITQKVMNGLG